MIDIYKQWRLFETSKQTSKIIGDLKMIRNESNILRHELIGLMCEVVKASNASLIGIHGHIVNETMKTLVLGKERKRVSKQGTTFRIVLGEKKLLIDGNLLVARPEDRIKKKFKKW